MGRGIGALRIAIEDFLRTSFLGDFVHNLRVRFVEQVERDTVDDLLGGIIDNLDTSLLPREYRQIIEKMRRGDRQGLAVAVFGAVLGMAVGIFSGASRPIAALMEQATEKVAHSGLLSPYDLALLYARGTFNFDAIKEEMIRNGFREGDIEAFKEINRRLMNPQDLIQLSYRFPDQSKAYLDKLAKEGFSAADVQRMRQAAEYFPGVQDLILFAVREVYTPEIRDRYGLAEEFPSQFGSAAALLGLSPENANRYWQAHWVLPSLMSGFDMLHRLRPGTTDTPFTIENMRDLIKAHDLAPYWRDRLIQLSYNPITRVDLRRLWRDGVIDRDRLYGGYLDIGYKPTDAQLLTEWTMRQSQGQGKDLTRSAIQQAFNLGIFDEQQALNALMDLGYDENEARFWLSLTTAQTELADTQEQIDYLEFLYLNGEIDEQELHNQLSRLDLSTEAIRRTVDILNIRRRKAIKLPSLTDLEDFYRNDVITSEQYRDYLRRKNYSEAAIDQIIKNTDILEAKARAKEAEAAQKEEERIAASERASATRKDKAQIDVQIAEINTDIADLKVAKHETTNAEELEAIDLRIDQLKAQIAQLRIDKALVTVEGV